MLAQYRGAWHKTKAARYLPDILFVRLGRYLLERRLRIYQNKTSPHTTHAAAYVISLQQLPHIHIVCIYIYAFLLVSSRPMLKIH